LCIKNALPALYKFLPGELRLIDEIKYLFFIFLNIGRSTG